MNVDVHVGYISGQHRNLVSSATTLLKIETH